MSGRETVATPWGRWDPRAAPAALTPLDAARGYAVYGPYTIVLRRPHPEVETLRASLRADLPPRRACRPVFFDPAGWLPWPGALPPDEGRALRMITDFLSEGVIDDDVLSGRVTPGGALVRWLRRAWSAAPT